MRKHARCTKCGLPRHQLAFRKTRLSTCSKCWRLRDRYPAYTLRIDDRRKMSVPAELYGITKPALLRLNMDGTWEFLPDTEPEAA